MKKLLFTIFFILFFVNAHSQSYLKRFIGNDSSTIANSPTGQALSATFFQSRIGGQHWDLSRAVAIRFITPYDFANYSLASAKTMAKDSNWVLLIPGGYSTDSTLTLTAADSALSVFDFRGNGLTFNGIFNLKTQSPPTTNLTNGIRLYVEDVSGSAELKVRDEAGNVIVLSDLSAAAAAGWTDDGTVIRLTTSGDSVGIGTSSPTEKLTVENGHIQINRTGITTDPKLILSVGTLGSETQKWILLVDNNDFDRLKIRDDTNSNNLFTFRADGYLQKNEVISMDAIAWFPPSTNGADLDTLNSREEVYAFDQTTAEILYVKNYLPTWFTSLDSVEVLISTSSTAGDSVSFTLQYYARGNGEAIGTGLGNSQADTLDLGTTADIVQRIVFSGTFGNLSANDEIVWQLQRDTSINDNVAADVRVHRTNFYIK